MNQKELRKYLNVIKRAISLIEGMLENDDEGLLEQLANPIQVQTPQPPPPPPEIPPEPSPDPAVLESIRVARQKHIQDLMNIDVWPQAVPPFIIANVSESDMVNRANAILDMMLDRSIQDKTFLDFGCGEGWVAQEVVKRGVRQSVGYDIVSHDDWKNRVGSEFTTDFASLKQGHYDVIMLYDVLDHCVDPLDVMSKVKSCLKPGGLIVVRCHPWTSRTATHLYKQGINRAYLHLFLSWEEIKSLIDQEPMFTRMEKAPIDAYKWWFHDFKITRERFIREDVSEFFFVPAFKELLANEQQIPIEHIDGFLDLLRIQFVDYQLSL